jgi:Zn-dependent peptidase ImmA (M78 family)/transcriptional regulator with XRE-family HTH domain
MEDMLEARINGQVLRWARERRAWDYDKVVKSTKISADLLQKWEDGLAYPPFGKAELLAATLKVPFGFLFLSKPPHDASPISDFRTVKGKRPEKASPDLLSIINQARIRQDWYREFSEGNGASPLAMVGAFSLESGVEAVAADICATLAITEETRLQADSHAAFLSRLSEAAQDAGVLVMRSGIVGAGNSNRLSVSEFRGFALTDPYAPLIFINSRDAYSAQVFTLVHELAHIWINRSGISNPDPTEDVHDGVERFCNRVAAEVLVPKAEFLEAWVGLREKQLFPSVISRQFWVSPLVVIVRAYETGKISDSEFSRLTKIQKNKKVVPRKSKGGNPIRTMLARNGRRLTTGVLSAVRESRLVFRDAEHILGVRSGGLATLIRKNIGR